MHTRGIFALFAATTAMSCNNGPEPLELPDVVASSRYIDLRVDTDASAVCMNDHLAGVDRFIEETAAFIGVPPPAGRIDFVLFSKDDRYPATWPCGTVDANCYDDHGDRPGGTIYVDPAEPANGQEIAGDQWHELVHAVDVPANGRGHWLLEEGLATYLGATGTSDSAADQFSESRLVDMFDRTEPAPGLYDIAMHFAGSLIERHGIEAFMDLRRAVPAGATYDDFTAIYQDVYTEPLSAALAWMRGRVVTGRKKDTTCDGEPANWSSDEPTLLRAELAGACGDGWFYGGLGFNLALAAPDDTPGIYLKSFVIDVPAASLYHLEIRAPDLGAFGYLASCGDTAPGIVSSYDGRGSTARLSPGPHELVIGFPAGVATEFSVELRDEGSPP